MKVFVCLCLLVVAVGASFLEEQELFQAFKVEYSKTYRNQAEEIKRSSIFKNNLRAIEQHNSLYAQGLVSYKQGVNQFTDLTHDEFLATLTLKVSKPDLNATTQHVISGLEIPSSVDWRTDGQVTEVKNQGGCGSCWAFAVVGATEAAYKRKNGRLVSLSEQQLVDCTTSINAGCSYGYMIETYPYVQSTGLESESDYDYKGSNQACQFDSSKVVTRISRSVAMYWNEGAILDAVANIGPVSVNIDASYLSSYSSGIYDDSRCSTDKLNHSVLIVGYGSENGKDFWIIKNSWGGGFGESGFFRMLRGVNECGISEYAAYPIID